MMTYWTSLKRFQRGKLLEIIKSKQNKLERERGQPATLVYKLIWQISFPNKFRRLAPFLFFLWCVLTWHHYSFFFFVFGISLRIRFVFPSGIYFIRIVLIYQCPPVLYIYKLGCTVCIEWLACFVLFLLSKRGREEIKRRRLYLYFNVLYNTFLSLGCSTAWQQQSTSHFYFWEITRAVVAWDGQTNIKI